MKAFDLQVTGSLIVTGSIRTTDGTFILSGSDSNASASFSTRVTTNESNITLATASIAALTASISRLNTEISTDDTDMTLATASIAAITASINDNLDQAVKQASAVTFATVDTGQGANELYDMNQNVKTDSNVTFGVITSGDINSSGTITATEIHTTFVSSSITVASGSNNFGDATDDHHSFTGSLDISGSGTVLKVSDGNVVVSDTLTATNIGAFTAAGAIDFDDQNMTNVDIDSGTITGLDTDLAVADGGTGASSFTDGYVLLGSGTSAITALNVTADGAMLVGDGSTDPVAESGATLRTSIGVGTTDDVKFANITGSGNISGSSISTGSFGHITLSEGLEIGGVYRTSLSNNDAGSSNTVFGYAAGASIVSGCDNNVFIGHQVADATLTNAADRNVGIGYTALSALTSGDRNVAIGAYAGVSNTAAGHLTLIGYNAGYAINSTDADGTVCIGNEAGIALTSGQANTVIGYQAAHDLTTGDYNTVLGYEALDRATTAALRNVAIGHQAMHGNFTTAAVVDCVAIGVNALEATLTAGASGTVAIGKAAGAALTSGAGNLAVGSGSLLVMTTGDYNTAIGHRALKTNVSGDFNVAVGYEALTTANEDTANQNTALGYKALTLLTTGINNTAVGSLAGGEGTITGDSNTLIGKSAGATLAGGARNVAIGTNALKVLTAGGTADLGNVAIGYGALDSLQTGMSNVAIGVAAMDGAAGAVSNCVVIGDRAADGVLTTAADGAVALGYHALGALTSGAENTAVGFEAGKAMTVGSNLTAVGYQAGLLLTLGANANTAIGAGALKAGNAATTDHNTCVGYIAGDAITSGNKNTIIGAEADPSAGGATNQTAVGYGAQGQADNSVTLGDAAVTAVYMSSDSQALVHSCGIQFPGTQVANGGANVLDDYEEGTWTPVFAGNSTAGAFTYNYQAGEYTKIGNLVHVQFIVSVTAVDPLPAGTYVFITGLPFTNSNDVGKSEGASLNCNYWKTESSIGTPSGFVFRNQAYILLTHSVAGGATDVGVLTPAEFCGGSTGALSGNRYLYGSVDYYVD